MDYIGLLYVYAHDDLFDHQEWNIADARNHLVWHPMYLDLIPPYVGIQPPAARDIDMQLTKVLVMGGNNEIENADEDVEEEEEEEEDPKEDPNWAEEEVPRTPTPPVVKEEDVNHEPNQANWDFDRNLEIPDCGRREPEVDPTIWRDIYVMNEYPQAINEVVPEPVVPEPIEVKDNDGTITIEAWEIVNRVWEEAERELGMEEDNENGQRVRNEDEEENNEGEQGERERMRNKTMRP